jgi:GDPmannose 4,6-dehydratase
MTRLIGEIRPREIYNLAGMSQVGVSFDTPGSSFDINMSGTLNVLEAVRNLDLVAVTRIYQASTSEMYGSAPAPQNEDTKMEPCSPYGVSKLAAYHLARTYRQAYGMYVSNGILFNHESPLRGEDFVTRKITRAVAQIEAGRADALLLGNLDSIRDWGAAEDYVEGMWMMLQQKTADDFVLATGAAHSVREFVERAFAQIGVKLEWQGLGVDEVGRDAKSGRALVAIDETLFRPAEVHHLLGDAAKARAALGWAPTTSFDALVSQMVNADRALLREEPQSWSMAS